MGGKIDQWYYELRCLYSASREMHIFAFSPHFLYTTNIITLKIFPSFHLPIFKSVAKKIFLGRKNIEGAFAPPPFTHPSYAYAYTKWICITLVTHSYVYTSRTHHHDTLIRMRINLVGIRNVTATLTMYIYILFLSAFNCDVLSIL